MPRPPGSSRSISCPGVAPGLVTDACGLLQPVQCDIQQQRRNNTALGSSLPGRREPFPGLENPCLKPPGDHPLRRETADHLQQMLVADLVECACQVRVKNPHPPGLPAQGVEKRFYRVVAAAARPEPIGPGLEPGLPLGLQRITYPRLVAPIRNNRNSERPHFGLITGFRYIHPPDRGRPVRADGGVHAHRHLGPGLAGQRDQPVDSRGPPARVALRRLPHADQRVAPAPQHQLLQVPGQRPVTGLHRLEDPPAQPPYLPLMMPPVHTLPGVTIERGQPLRSVHRSVQRARQFRHSRSLRSKGSPDCVSALSGPGTGPGIRPVIQAPSGGDPDPRRRFPAAFQPPAFASQPPCPARDFRPPYGRPTAPPAHTRACTTDPDEVATFRTHETRTGPGALSTPGTTVPTGRGTCAAAACRLSAAGPCHPGKPTPARDAYVTRHQQGFPGSRPSGPSPHP